MRVGVGVAWLLLGLMPCLRSARAVATEPVRLVFLAADGHSLRADDGDALGVSRHVSNDAALPTSGQLAAPVERDPELFRIAIEGPASSEEVLHVTLESIDDGGVRRSLLRYVPLIRERAKDAPARWLSPFIRLVADATDAGAPGMDTQLLRVRLRDHVRASYVGTAGPVEAALNVGARGDGARARQILRGRLRLVVLRNARGGTPVIGQDDESALDLARRQVEIANEIWAQCFVEFGSPSTTEAVVLDPPPPALLAVADEDGLPARGGGRIQLTANGIVIDPVSTVAGQSARETARRIVRALKNKGFVGEISINPRAENGAGESADVVVRNRQGALAVLAPRGDAPLSSDLAQRVAIGTVQLDDGIQQFDNMVAATGTLEERTLVKLLGDRDPRTIDVFFVNRFVAPERQGEAFIEADGSTMANSLILDRNAVRFERQAWVQAHELGHVLLDEPFHPDNFGWDRPSLLMDSDARAGRVTGPKRLSDSECERVRRRSGDRAYPPLLVPVD